MTGLDLLNARKRRGITQRQVAQELGVTQAYVSMLEKERRHLPAHVVSQVLRQYEVDPLALPLHGKESWSELDSARLTTQLASLGYPGFAYMRAQSTWNPSELLIASLAKDNLETRVAEALPWLVLNYDKMDWNWVMDESKLRDAQNRLGFTVTLARKVAERNGLSVATSRLASLENRLQRSKLEHVGTFCNERMSTAEKQWLQNRSTPEAKQWNILSDLAPEHLAHVTSA